MSFRPANEAPGSKHPLHCPVCQRGFNTPLGRSIHCRDDHGITLLISEHDHRRVDAFHARNDNHPYGGDAA